jgi:protein involved in polysaccharide export with SLBB domain
MLSLTACASVHTTKNEVDVPQTLLQSTERYQKEYLLLPDDQVEVVVQRSPEVSRTVLIRPDGNISLPLLGDVKAAGLSPRELAAKLTELFAKRMIGPEVTVIAVRVRPATIYVSGEVGVSAALPLRDAPTVMQAVALAGGLKKSGAVGDVVIIRLNAQGRLQAIRVPHVAHGQPGPYMAMRAFRLEPDDLIFVPENDRSQFTRWVDDVINKPLSGVNSLLSPLINYKLIQTLDNQVH